MRTTTARQSHGTPASRQMESPGAAPKVLGGPDERRARPSRRPGTCMSRRMLGAQQRGAASRSPSGAPLQRIPTLEGCDCAPTGARVGARPQPIHVPWARRQPIHQNRRSSHPSTHASVPSMPVLSWPPPPPLALAKSVVTWRCEPRPEDSSRSSRPIEKKGPFPPFSLYFNKACLPHTPNLARVLLLFTPDIFKHTKDGSGPLAIAFPTASRPRPSSPSPSPTTHARLPGNKHRPPTHV